MKLLAFRSYIVISRHFNKSPIKRCLNVWASSSPVSPLFPPSIAPVLPSTVGNRNKVIENPLTIEPILTPTSITKDVLVPAFTRLQVQDKIKEKQLPARQSGKVKKIYATGYFSMNMLRIRRRKMKKHQLKKFRKRMLAFILRQRQKREIRKEKLFRAELLAKIREAENFDAEQYVENVLRTIQKAPKKETKEEKLDKVFDLIRENRKETILLRPKFDDPVPDDFEKLK